MGGPTQDFVQSMLSFKSDFKVVLHFSALVFLGLGHLLQVKIQFGKRQFQL